MAAVDCVTRFGIASAAAPAAWAGKEASRKFVDWLPPISVPVIDLKTGRMTAPWYRYEQELSRRLGGIEGQSITQVQQTVTATQAQVQTTTQYATQVSDYAQGIAATAQATAEVTQSSGLSGAGSIPPPPSPPNRPNYQVQ